MQVKDSVFGGIQVGNSKGSGTLLTSLESQEPNNRPVLPRRAKKQQTSFAWLYTYCETVAGDLDSNV
jgi:hypothetical protein